MPGSNFIMKEKIRVLIIDDSAVVRRMLKEFLSSDSDIEVVGTAIDPYIARQKIKKLDPTVLTLDIEMPRMDGLSFLNNLMRLRPMSVVMVSSKTKAGAETTLKALELGAVDFVFKPDAHSTYNIDEYRHEIIEKVKAAAQARIQNYSNANHYNLEKIGSGKEKTYKTSAVDSGSSGYIAKQAATCRRTINGFKQAGEHIEVIAIGASTGGTEAIKYILSRLPADGPPIVVVQHIPKTFSAAFARSANNLSAKNVVEAKDSQILENGCVYISPGDRHLKLRREGKQYICTLDNGPKVNRHKPSVDILFRSVAETVGSSAIGVLLTGMGTDGAKGLLNMRNCGALTFAQDQLSSVVWGMPGEAVYLGAAQKVVSLDEVSSQIIAIGEQMIES